jgi:hypothetical protein
MKNKTVAVCVCAATLIAFPICGNAALNDLLGNMTITSSGTLGGGEYLFNPGDQVVEQDGYTIYYSGYQGSSDARTLLFTVFEDEKSYQVFFTSPTTIRIKDVAMNIISFDNTSLKVQFVHE